VIAESTTTNTDEIFLDLEDSVPAELKNTTRQEVIELVQEHDWKETALSYRINGTDTRWWYKDVIDIISSVGDEIDSIIVPKVRNWSNIEVVATLLDSIERNEGIDGTPINITPQIETAAGMNNVIDIVSTTTRLDAVLFGPADYAASIGAAHVDRDYPGHYWHYPLSRISHAAASAGLLAIGGPYPDTEDASGFRDACRHERDLGYDGKVVIHPDQVNTANDVFSPNPDEARRARTIVDRYEGTDGNSVASIDGKVIDRETYRMAKQIVVKAERADIL